MDLLTRTVGLPSSMRTIDPAVCFADLDLDSLAFLQMQVELSEAYGVELPDDRAHAYTIGEIVATVQGRIDGASAA
jgi:acyl carrier protein